MALQICPRCGVKAITWTVNEKASPLTQWECGRCGYEAEEDETREGNCPRCASVKSCLLVRDADGVHRWCCACGYFESTAEAF